MYILERLEFQGTEKCPQRRWKQLAMCGNREPLARVLAKQRHPRVWRMTENCATPNMMLQRGKKSA
jgi:hypothetical protein